MLSAFIPSRLSYSAVPLARQQIHQRSVQFGPLVLKSDPRKLPTPTTDRDRTVSRRSKPSSRTFLNVEQTYPWIFLLIQDKMSRHRGAKQSRQWELLGIISLFNFVIMKALYLSFQIVSYLFRLCLQLTLLLVVGRSWIVYWLKILTI